MHQRITPCKLIKPPSEAAFVIADRIRILQGAKGVIRELPQEDGSWACVEWDLEYRTQRKWYVNVSDLELELLTPEEQEKLADQKRREEHAMRYL